jgi:hypothetical protein
MTTYLPSMDTSTRFLRTVLVGVLRGCSSDQWEHCASRTKIPSPSFVKWEAWLLALAGIFLSYEAFIDWARRDLLSKKKCLHASECDPASYITWRKPCTL